MNKNRNTALLALAVVVPVASFIGYMQYQSSLRREYETAKESFLIMERVARMEKRLNAERIAIGQRPQPSQTTKQRADAEIRLRNAADAAGMPGPEAVKATIVNTEP